MSGARGVRSVSSGIVAVAVALPLLIATSGCSKIREKLFASKAHADGGAETAVVDGDAGPPTLLAPLTTDAPPARSTTGMKVPDDFPASVPLYPSAKVTAALTNEKGDSKGHVLVLQTTDSPDAVAAFYVKSMRRAKQTIDMTAGKTRMLTFHDATSSLDVALTITPSTGHTTVNLTVTPTGGH